MKDCKINCKNNLKSLKSQFNNIDKLTFEVPKEFVGELRNYQYKGYCYLKTLSL